jgi:hypothetical protein
MTTWYVRTDDSDDPVGPVSTEVVTKGLLARKVPVDAHVCRVGDTEWLPIGSLAEFRSAVRQAAPPPPSAARKRAVPLPEMRSLVPEGAELELGQDDLKEESDVDIEVEEGEAVEHSRFFLRNRLGVEQGPYSAAALAAGFREGRVPGAMLVRKDGEPNVLSLSVFLARRGVETNKEDRFYVRDRSGTEQGTYSVAALASAFQAGRLPGDVLVRKDGASTLIPLTSFLAINGVDVTRSAEAASGAALSGAEPAQRADARSGAPRIEPFTLAVVGCVIVVPVIIALASLLGRGESERSERASAPGIKTASSPPVSMPPQAAAPAPRPPTLPELFERYDCVDGISIVEASGFNPCAPPLRIVACRLTMNDADADSEVIGAGCRGASENNFTYCCPQVPFSGRIMTHP